jgi:hypothetical protein
VSAQFCAKGGTRRGAFMHQARRHFRELRSLVGVDTRVEIIL